MVKKLGNLIMIILMSVFLASCDFYEPEVSKIIDDTYNEVYALKIGEPKSIAIEELHQKYKFTKIEYTYDKKIVEIKDDKINGLKQGSTTIKASLSYKQYFFQTIDLGKAYVIEGDKEKYTPIKYMSDFFDEISKNPYGAFEITSDMEESLSINPRVYTPIRYFGGVIINPNGYTIKNLSIKSPELAAGVFIQIKDAVVQGLRFENLKVEGDITQTITTGGLSAFISKSFIEGVEIKGSVSHGFEIGGLAGSIGESTINKCSFTGEVKYGYDMGGFVGNLLNYMDLYETFFSITNSYAVATLIGKKDFFSYQTHPTMSGFSDSFKGGAIYNTYAVTQFQEDEKYKKSSFIDPFNIHEDLAKINNCLFSSISDYSPTMGAPWHKYLDIKKIEDQELKSGKSIIGFEEFTFVEGEYPKIKK